MSNPLEPEVKTNPQGDPITSVEPEQKTNPQGDPITSAAPIKVGGSSKDPHEGAKKQRVVTPEYMFFEAPRKREFITGFRPWRCSPAAWSTLPWRSSPTISRFRTS